MLGRFNQYLLDVLQVWSFLLLLTLSVTSLCYRTFIPRDTELAQLKGNGLFVFVIIGGVYLFYHLLKQVKQTTPQKLFLVGSLFYSILVLFMIFAVSDELRNDAVAVYHAALKLNVGNLSYLKKGAYLYRFPHQLGLVTFERIILQLTGVHSARIFFFINFVMIMSIHYLNWRITKLLFDDDRTSKVAILLSFLFLPHFFGILFVYGLIPGLFFSMFAIYFLIRYFVDRKWTNLLALILSLVLATLIRNNYVILAVTVAMVLFLDMLKRKSIASCAAVILLFTAIQLSSGAITSYYKNEASLAHLSGTPRLAWVAMGLDDNPKSPRLPGWYDESIDTVYVVNRGDYRKIQSISQKKLDKRLSELVARPAYAWNFFKTKFISTWMDGLFQTIWSGPSPKLGQSVKGSVWRDIFTGGLTYLLLSQLSNIVLFGIYFGSLIFLSYLIGRRQMINSLIFYPFIYLSGGILFHLVWEAKSQYAYPYVVLLIPVAAFGLRKLPEFKKTVLGRKIHQIILEKRRYVTEKMSRHLKI